MARSSRAGALAVLLLALLAVPAAARSTEEDCPTGPEGERCMGEETRRLRAAFGLPTVAALASEGIQVRRTFLLRGGKPVAALSFTRRAGEAPRLSVVIRGRDGLKTVEQTIAPEAWQQALDRSFPLFDDRWRRTFYRNDVNDAAIAAGMHGAQTCFHSWSYFVEVADVRPGQPGPGSTAGDPCTYSIETSGYTEFLTDLALRQLAPCTALIAGRYWTDSDRLEACARLDGDRAVGVGIANAVWNMVRSSEDELPRATLNTVFAPGIELRSEGRVVSGREAVATEWRRLLAHDGRTSYFSYDRVAAPRNDRGELHGFVYYATYEEGEGLRFVMAPLNARFVRDRSGRFRVDRITIGAYERQPPEPET